MLGAVAFTVGLMLHGDTRLMISLHSHAVTALVSPFD